MRYASVELFGTLFETLVLILYGLEVFIITDIGCRYMAFSIFQKSWKSLKKLSKSENLPIGIADPITRATPILYKQLQRLPFLKTMVEIEQKWPISITEEVKKLQKMFENIVNY